MKTSFFSRNAITISFLMLLAAGLFTGFLPHAPNVLAAGTGLNAELLNPIDQPKDAVSSDLRTAVVGFLNYFLGFLGLIAVAFVIYAGVLMVTSQGEEDSTTKGKKILLYAGAGIVIIMLSFAIVQLVVRAGESVA